MGSPLMASEPQFLHLLNGDKDAEFTGFLELMGGKCVKVLCKLYSSPSVECECILFIIVNEVMMLFCLKLVHGTLLHLKSTLFLAVAHYTP